MTVYCAAYFRHNVLVFDTCFRKSVCIGVVVGGLVGHDVRTKVLGVLARVLGVHVCS